MEELESILKFHAVRYPLMEPGDVVKLIYQNEFGGGHLIQDRARCLAYLRQEWRTTPKDPLCPLWEPIGGGLVRVNLAAVEEIGWLEDGFFQSARELCGNMASFLGKLSLVRDLTGKGIFSFPTGALEDYLGRYQAMGCPPVSHSEGYRNAYHPAYRVIREEYLPKR